MKNYYTVVNHDDKFPSIVDTCLNIGTGVAKKNMKHTKKEAIQFLADVEAAKQVSIATAKEYIGRRKHYFNSVKDIFRKELEMLNATSFSIVYVSFKNIVD